MHDQLHHQQEHHRHDQPALTRSAIQATLHCLGGCEIGEVLGLVLATALGWGNAASIAVSVVLAFFFGYALTIHPVLRAGVPVHRALRLAGASDTVSIATMELVDNAFILVLPGALAVGLSDRSRQPRPHRTRSRSCRHPRAAHALTFPWLHLAPPRATVDRSGRSRGTRRHRWRR
jgi:hypothetical protein